MARMAEQTKAPAARKAAAKPRGQSKRGGARASVSPKATVAKRKKATAKGAEKAVAKAKAKGAVGPGGPAPQRALRNTAVVARLEGGASVKTVAAEFVLSERSVRLIREQSKSWTKPLEEEPMGIIENVVRDYRRSIEDFLAMAYRNEDANPAVAVAALKGALACRERYVELLSAVGKLPENLELFRAESVLRRLADRMLETMALVEAGELSAADAAEVFRQITEAPGEQPALRAVA